MTTLVEEALTTLAHVGRPTSDVHEADIYKFGFKLAREIAELRSICAVAVQKDAKPGQKSQWPRGTRRKICSTVSRDTRRSRFEENMSMLVRGKILRTAILVSVNALINIVVFQGPYTKLECP